MKKYAGNILSDASDRERAASEFGRTFVVEAGAGTGKTTILVDRILILLMRADREISLERVAAITYTRKAAGEMRARLREALLAFSDWCESKSAPAESHLHEVFSRLPLEKDEIRRRTRRALGELERASIATIHSFCARVLRRFPAEAGVDPRFSEDDGTVFEERFDEEWKAWLTEELGEKTPRAKEWNAVLDRGLSIADLESFTRKLSDENISLDAFRESVESGRLFTVNAKWLDELKNDALALVLDRKEVNLVRQLRESARIFDVFTEGNPGGFVEAEVMSAGLASKLAGWEDADLDRAKEIVTVARKLLETDPDAVRGAFGIVYPFVKAFREAFVREGYLSFSALLSRTRDLLLRKDVREEAKGWFDQILVDEFQDTDPIQYEIVFCLAEKKGAFASDVKEIALEPGKLFIVGDPKQSIYSFRDADLRAYDGIVRVRLKKTGKADILKLAVNFRSRKPALDTVNGLFEKIIREEPGLQPKYEAIAADPSDCGKGGRVMYREVIAEGGGPLASSSDAAEAEALSLAKFISAEIVSRWEITAKDGSVRPAKWGDIALLFQKMTALDVYTTAFREAGIPFVVEGEKTFYERQEFTDFLNLLAVLANEDDELALAGLFRSPIGGLDDAELAEAMLSRERNSGGWVFPGNAPWADKTARLLACLKEIREATARLPLPRILDVVFERLPVVETAVVMAGGESARANLMKIRRVAAELGADHGMTLRKFVDYLRARVKDLAEEGESPLAEEGQNDVKLLTIHKAKGLEFPVVILPGLQAGTGGGDDDGVRIGEDWKSGRFGVKVGKFRTAVAIELESAEKKYRDAETRRLLYVAATRAQNVLVFSAAPSGRQTRGLLEILAEGAPDLKNTAEKSIPCGSGVLEIEKVTVFFDAPSVSRRRESWFAARNPAHLKTWKNRADREKMALQAKSFIRPSSAHEENRAEWKQSEARPSVVDRDALVFGSAAHAVLERMDFSRGGKDVSQLIAEEMKTFPEAGPSMAKSLEEMFKEFCRSDAFKELSKGKILAREIPCLLPWMIPGQDFPAASEGVIDLVGEWNAELVVVDYKTDRVSEKDVKHHAERYHQQGEIYAKAVSESTGRVVKRFRLIFLRTGTFVDLEVAGGAV